MEWSPCMLESPEIDDARVKDHFQKLMRRLILIGHHNSMVHFIIFPMELCREDGLAINLKRCQTTVCAAVKVREAQRMLRQFRSRQMPNEAESLITFHDEMIEELTTTFCPLPI